MAFLQLFNGSGFTYPPNMGLLAETASADAFSFSVKVIDAADEKVMMGGHVMIHGRPSSAKTFSSSGGKIHFRVGTVTWASAGTTVRVGVQDATTVTDILLTPDGTFDVYGDLVQGTDSLSSNTWKTVSMSSGSKSIAHGDLICLVWDMTVRNGSDSVQVSGHLRVAGASVTGIPMFRAYTTSWQSADSLRPLAVIEFDDGTLGTIVGSGPPIVTVSSAETYTDSTNPDERGNVFQVPFACMCEGFMINMYNNGVATSDNTVTLYSDPLGTPTSMASYTQLAEQMAQNQRHHIRLFSSQVQLKPNTDYCLAVKATSSGNVSMQPYIFGSTAHKKLCGMDGFMKATRNNGSGAFSTTDGTFYDAYPLISAIDVGPWPTYQLGM